MEIQRDLQQPHNTTINILVVVAAVNASDRTPYYPDEIREVALMDDRYVSNTVFDGHEFAYFSINISVLCAVVWPFFVFYCQIHN
jgi:hypothetical protein